MTRQKLSGMNRILVGFTYFSMFLGAGNLIFLPSMAAQAGNRTWQALAGFLISAVGIPVLAGAVTALAGGLDALADRVGKHFSWSLTLALCLFMGPCLLIPGTAKTSFETIILPLFTAMGIRMGGPLLWGRFTVLTAARLLSSVVFLAMAVLLALRPERFTDCLGKLFCPAMLILLAMLFIGCLIWPVGAVSAPAAAYSEKTVFRGFLEGRRAMEAMAAVSFAAVAALNIRERGVSFEGALGRETAKTGIVAGILLILVYTVLAYMGSLVGNRVGAGADGARILGYAAGNLFGNTGKVMLGIIFFLASLGTCAGLLAGSAGQFADRFPAVGYRLWLLLFGIMALAVLNIGYAGMTAMARQALNLLYPMVMVLVFLGLFHRFLGGRRLVYQCAVFCAGIEGAVYVLEQMKNPALSGLEGIFGLFGRLPGYSTGLGWILPAFVGAIAGMCLGQKETTG